MEMGYRYTARVELREDESLFDPSLSLSGSLKSSPVLVLLGQLTQSFQWLTVPPSYPRESGQRGEKEWRPEQKLGQLRLAGSPDWPGGRSARGKCGLFPPEIKSYGLAKRDFRLGLGGAWRFRPNNEGIWIYRGQAGETN